MGRLDRFRCHRNGFLEIHGKLLQGILGRVHLLLEGFTCSQLPGEVSGFDPVGDFLGLLEGELVLVKGLVKLDLALPP